MSIECVKCGNDNSAEAALCSRGTWPFSPEAWPLTSLILRRVTIDTSCINAKRKNVHLNRIEQWAANGHLLIQRADVMLEELNGRERLAKAEQTEPHPEGWLLGIPEGPTWASQHSSQAPTSKTPYGIFSSPLSTVCQQASGGTSST
jgi:hypothetical protein